MLTNTQKTSVQCGTFQLRVISFQNRFVFFRKRYNTIFTFFIQSMCGKSHACQIQIRRLGRFKGPTKIKSIVKYKVCNCLESISWKKKMLCSFHSGSLIPHSIMNEIAINCFLEL